MFAAALTLQSAQQNYTRDQQALGQLNIEIEQIPDAARRSPTELELMIEQVNLAYQTFDKQEREANTEVQHLKNIQARRQELEQQRAKSMHLASSYKDLTRLLSRDGLQGFLVQKAEEGIVYHANEILDRISGGVLRLALRPSTDRKGGELDMVAYNTAISASEAQPILLLSGSQQFRVAVSLALGIGRYAGNENHRVEAAIIDEGFGSLDKKGRSEMIHAIKALASELKCIIVVSHESEFFDEFPNKYFVELVNGSTKISLT
jgi:DNA repair exonuclease SbcCD ATPase subunit